MGSTERQRRTIKRPSRFDDENFELTRKKEKEVTHDEENLKKPSDTKKAGEMERTVSKQTLKKKSKGVALKESNGELKKLSERNINNRPSSEYLSEINTPSLCRESVESVAEVEIKDFQGKVIFKILRSYRSQACNAPTFNSTVANLVIALITPSVILGRKITANQLEEYVTSVQTLVKMMIYRLEGGGIVPVLKLIRDGENVKLALKNVDIDSPKAAEVLEGGKCETIDERRNFFFQNGEQQGND